MVDGELRIGDSIPRLVSLEGAAQGVSFYLLEKSSFLLGSSPQSDIYLNSNNVSEEHLRIEIDENSHVITDLSKGKTYVNGESVDIYVLQDGDHIRVGFEILAFNFREITEQNLISIQKDLERLSLQTSSSFRDFATLRILEGQNKDMIYPLKGKKVFLMGRGSTNDIKIVDTKISRVHCKIEIEDEEYLLFDQNSTNGIFVRGERKDIHSLEDGDHIRVGFTIMEFKLPKKESESEL